MTSQIPLSEAMLHGSTMLKPCAGGHEDPRGGYGCALDMAVVAVGGQRWIDATKHWPWLGLRRLNCYYDDIIEVAYKFDSDVMRRPTMTFDAFVDWVRTIEPPPSILPNAIVEIPVSSEVWE